MAEYNIDLEELEKKLTTKQVEALKLLTKERKKRILKYGGARSGKTFLDVLTIVIRACKYPGSRHLIARLRWSHAKISLWLDTIPGVLRFIGIDDVTWFGKLENKEQDHYIKFSNGSEIWVDGLDDKERVDKILGREYVTIYPNEVSQIAWPTVTTLLTRLSQKIDGCLNVALFDCNPPSKHHWTYKLFILGKDPETGEDISNHNDYACIRMNPTDNAENLADGYIEDNLEHLPEDKRRRFLLGEYGDSAGAIFTNWDIVDEVSEDVIKHSRRSIGLDFGFSVDPAACVDVYVNGEDIYLDELIYDRGLTNQQLAERIKKLGVQDVGILADSAEPKSIHELKAAKIRANGAEKGPDSIRAGVDWLRSHKLYVTRRSVNLITELQEYVWSQNRDGNFEPKPIDDYNHAIDAVRYAVDPIRRRANDNMSVSDYKLGDIGL